MTKYLISFPSAAMASLSDEELEAASSDTRRIVAEAKAAGVWVFGGALDDSVSESVSPDGTVTSVDEASVRQLDGGFALLELPSIEDARSWAAKLGAACRCSQEVRAFHYDPES
jgi:hypothetical protein